MYSLLQVLKKTNYLVVAESSLNILNDDQLLV